MNGYKAFYQNKTTEIYAETSYKAQQKAAELWKVRPKSVYKIAVVLCERKDGSTVIHSGAEL